MTIHSLIGSASRPMNKDESQIFLGSMMNSELKDTFDEAFVEEFQFSSKILYDRLKTYSTVKITKGLALLTMVMAKGNPGNLVMWAYTFHKMNKGKVLTLNDFAGVFPFGVPSEEGLIITWDAQKDSITGSNLIDDIKNWN